MNIFPSRNQICLCPLLILLRIPTLDCKGSSRRTSPTAGPSVADLFRDFEKSVDTGLPQWMRSKLELVYANKTNCDREHMEAMLTARQQSYLQRFKNDLEEYESMVERSFREQVGRINMVLIPTALAALLLLLLLHVIAVARRKKLQMTQRGEGIMMDIEGLLPRGHDTTTITVSGDTTLITTTMGATTVAVSRHRSSITVSGAGANLFVTSSQIPENTTVVHFEENAHPSCVCGHAQQDREVPPPYQGKR